MNIKKIILRGVILALICVIIACLGGIAPLDLPVILIVGLLVMILAALMVIIHNQGSDKD